MHADLGVAGGGLLLAAGVGALVVGFVWSPDPAPSARARRAETPLPPLPALVASERLPGRPLFPSPVARTTTGPPQELRLVGVSHGTPRLAVVVAQSGTVVLAIGDTVSGLRVTAIGRHTVTLIGARDTLHLELPETSP